jgi:hypothetical protein
MDKRTYQAEWTRQYEGTSACSLVADAANDLGPIPELLPPCFRLTSIERLSAARGCLNRSTLFHEKADGMHNLISAVFRWVIRHFLSFFNDLLSALLG